MTFRVLGVVFAACLLGGCADASWDHAKSFVGLGDAPAAPPAADAATANPAPAETPAAKPDAAANEWCDQVAKAAQTEAAEQGFDKPTQQRRGQSAYQQCATSPGAIGY